MPGVHPTTQAMTVANLRTDGRYEITALARAQAADETTSLKVPFSFIVQDRKPARRGRSAALTWTMMATFWRRV